MRIDLNADMGEGFGPWRMGDDNGLLGVVSSANIACGFHAGDADQMARVMAQAGARGVGIGAHPGFADLQGFGRRRMRMSGEELANLVAYQLGAARGMAASVGQRVRHLKLHGALSNMAAEDADVARACFAAALRVDPQIILVVLAGTVMQHVASDLGALWAGEIFADRAYGDDARLVDRSQPGAVIHDADRAAARIRQMLREGAIISASGKRLPARIDTVCVHGDSPGALAMAKRLAGALREDGLEIRPLDIPR